MTAEIFTHKLSIRNIQIGITNSAELYLTSKETIRIECITGFIFLEKRGRLGSSKNSKVSFDVSEQILLEKDKTYTIPFSFDFPETDIETYSGKNVNFSYISEFHLDINEYDLDKLDRGLMDKLKSFISSNDSVILSQNLEVKNVDKTYLVSNDTIELKFQPNPKVLVGVLITIGLALYFFLNKFEVWYAFAGVGIFLALMVIIPKILKGIFGKISIESTSGENGIRFNLKKTRKFNLSNQSLYFEIQEKVIDNRGTKSKTYMETIYTSAEHSLSEFRQSANIEIDYPEQKGLYTLNTSNVKIQWFVVLEGKQFGIPLKFKSEFKVNRQG